MSQTPGGSGEALLTGPVSVNQHNCAQIDGALLVAPEDWRLESEDGTQTNPETTQSRLVRLGAEMSFVGGYRGPSEEQLVSVEDCIDDETTAIFYIAGMA